MCRPAVSVVLVESAVPTFLVMVFLFLLFLLFLLLLLLLLLSGVFNLFLFVLSSKLLFFFKLGSSAGTVLGLTKELLLLLGSEPTTSLPIAEGTMSIAAAGSMG